MATSALIGNRPPGPEQSLEVSTPKIVFYYTEVRLPDSEAFVTRISLVENDQASPEVKDIYEKTLRGKPGNFQKALAHRPEMLKNFLGFYASVGRSLDRKLYELIYIRVSLINSCHY
jgi:alkylhydroperoxidase family enzyme